MQFCQPPFQPTGMPNYGQPCGFNAYIPNQINGYPDIIGEGNIAYIISPDGSTHLVFYPTFHWPPQWRTFLQNPCVGNLSNPYLNNLGVWFVRNIFSPIRPAVFPQSYQELNMFQYPRTASECCFDISPAELSLKFHNDVCTSSTDLQYFMSKQFNWYQRPTACASVQVACTVANSATVCDHELSCAKPCNPTPAQPCHCSPNKDKKNIKCICNTNSTSQMSIDSTRSKRGRHKKKSHRSRRSKNTCECTEQSNSGKFKKTSSQMSVDPISSSCRCNERSHELRILKFKRSRVTCECGPLGADKGVATYTDQGIGCAPDKGQETQTTCSNSVPVIKVSKGSCNSMRYKAETWRPKGCSCSSSCSTSGTE